jgi:hypothetical protein
VVPGAPRADGATSGPAWEEPVRQARTTGSTGGPGRLGVRDFSYRSARPDAPGPAAEGSEQQPAGSDVDRLVWGTVGVGALSVITLLTLLMAGHFTDHGFLMVFAVPYLAVLVGWAARRTGAERRAEGDRNVPDHGAGEPVGGGD